MIETPAPFQDVTLFPKDATMRQLNLTAEQQSQAQALGIDLTSFDWKAALTKGIKILEFLLAILANQADKQTVKTAGCPDPDVDCCCQCHEAGVKALESAQLSFTCCGDMCKP